MGAPDEYSTPMRRFYNPENRVIRYPSPPTGNAEPACGVSLKKPPN